MFVYRDANRLFSASFALLFLLMLPSTTRAADGRQLWQSRDQFVTLERHDSLQSGSALLNDHPIEISPDRLSAILTSIEIQPADSNKPEQIITNQSLETLVPQLVQGFRQAAPNEDVTFAIIGLHKSMLGLTKSPRVTTGRAFYKGDRLNIIFGLAQKDFNEREDRRLSPFTPGSRQVVAAGEWQLLPQPARKGFNLVRKDWLTFSDEWRPSVAQIPPSIDNIPSAQSLPALQGKRNPDVHTPAERLTTLKELQEKGLISDEEYRRKRLEIINGL